MSFAFGAQDGLGSVVALESRCTHRGGPLDEGPRNGNCVTCPWHGSVFALTDGSVRRGPASVPALVLQTRVRDGQIEVRTEDPGGLRSAVI